MLRLSAVPVGIASGISEALISELSLASQLPQVSDVLRLSAVPVGVASGLSAALISKLSLASQLP
ncbi:hypothetical protein, partial [Pseudomonas sp. PB103]|uniref:hypothetical protein n=1 Tax=Pseudomonas sp. PB103 TaxID=2494698 RepID=UPI001C49884E